MNIFLYLLRLRSILPYIMSYIIYYTIFPGDKNVYNRIHINGFDYHFMHFKYKIYIYILHFCEIYFLIFPSILSI